MPAPVVIPAAVALPPASPALHVTLPGGLVVGSVAPFLGPDPLAQALALAGSTNAALAPLGPIFALIDALVAVKRFADAVPGLITDPTALVQAVEHLGATIARLASILPQPSVPLLLLGVFDVIIGLLSGIVLELQAIAAQEARIAAATSVSSGLPTDAAGALNVIVDAAVAAVVVQRSYVSSSVLSAGPLLSVASNLASLAGLPGISISVDSSGSVADTLESIQVALSTLRAARSAIPI